MHTEAALQRVNQIIIKMLEMKTSRYFKNNVQDLHRQLLSEKIFSTFSQQKCEAIWNKLLFFDSLISTLYTFFKNHKYLNACADCLKQLMKILHHDTVFIMLQSHFLYKNQTDNQYIVKVVKSTFIVRSE